MKKCTAVLLVLVLFSARKANAQKDADTSQLIFEVTGVLVLDEKEIEDYSFCLHHGGQKMDSAFVKKMQAVTISLKRNETYTISYHKDGYIDKYIMIDTSVPKKKAKKEFYELSYEIELNPAKSKHKEEYKDHPVAIIKYIKNKDEFDFSDKYHSEIHHRAVKAVHTK
jgi:hypothetical protein